jgi:hypothetical protein
MENQLVLGCVGGRRRGGCGHVGDGGGRWRRLMVVAADDKAPVGEDDGGGRGWRLGAAVTGSGW